MMERERREWSNEKGEDGVVAAAASGAVVARDVAAAAAVEVKVPVAVDIDGIGDGYFEIADRDIRTAEAAAEV